ncbi:MAG: OsmC family protein [Sporichthyaceae bacterium]|nr:OsmC family protein [Sporichthyaceae bacterium]
MGYHVTVERTEDGYVARNGGGAEVAFGDGIGEFSPVELMLAALGGCNLVTVDPLTTQRGHRLVRLAATIEARKVKPNEIGDVTLTYDIQLPPEDPQAATVFRDVAERVHERHCTVSTALRQPTDVTVQLG